MERRTCLDGAIVDAKEMVSIPLSCNFTKYQAVNAKGYDDLYGYVLMTCDALHCGSFIDYCGGYPKEVQRSRSLRQL